MCSTAADRLLAELVADPAGQVTASPYETGRLVAIAPWLTGHEARLRYLCQTQHPDGGWGGPDGYALVSTLSAAGGLLAQLRHGPPQPEQVQRAAAAGLRALRRWLDPAAHLLVPDTTASELVVPALLAEVNRLVEGLGPPLRLPDGFDPRLPERALAALHAGRVTPGIAYALELFGPEGASSPMVRPTLGSVGLSPAATAAWLGGPAAGGDDAAACQGFLSRVQQHGGPVPVVNPITYFETAWVLNTLAIAGAGHTAPAVLLDRLADGLAPGGAPVAPGVPPDSDDTGVVLSALLRHGRAPSPASLLGFYADGHFRCFHGERDPSVSANAHALEAIALYLTVRPAARARFGPVADATVDWLRAAQHPDGSWWDKWHASPFYATACCVQALAEHGGAGTPEAIARAVAWVRDTERPGGGWGRWQATAEETAYAVQILALATPDATVTPALTRAAAFLSTPAFGADPPLWHGKDLYTPTRVVRASCLAAEIMAGRRPRRPVQVPSQRRASPQIGTPVEAHGKA